MNGLTQRELLDMFDRCEAYPEIRAAIRHALQPEVELPCCSQIIPVGAPYSCTELLGHEGDHVARGTSDAEGEYARWANR